MSNVAIGEPVDRLHQKATLPEEDGPITDAMIHRDVNRQGCRRCNWGRLAPLAQHK